MGGGIAAHLANLGFQVDLYDTDKESANAGLERAIRAKPPNFYNLESQKRIQIASIEDDLENIRFAHWVCEAIFENLEAKRELYEIIEPLLSDEAMISTNTSGLEIRMLAEGRSDSFQKRFLGTHFFNPPRYLKLIELISTDATDEKAVQAITQFLEDRVGRRVVHAKDTPGFIANRYGMWVLFHAIHTAEKLNFSIDLVDEIGGSLLGRPKTAVFRLADLIGIDIMMDIAKNLRKRCLHDPYCFVLDPPKTILKLEELGRIGSKSGQGYYRREGGEFLVLDFTTNAYRPPLKYDLPQIKELTKMPLERRFIEMLHLKSEIGELVRMHLVPCLQYAAEIAREVAYSCKDFDQVMKWGWGWSMGPFEMIDAIGYDTLKSYWDATPLYDYQPFYKQEEYLDFQTLQHVVLKKEPKYTKVSDFTVIQSGDNYRIRSDNDGNYIFEFHSKVNAIDTHLIRALLDHLKETPNARWLLANEGPHFSVGFDLKHFLSAAEEKRFEDVRSWLRDLQQAGQALLQTRSIAIVQGYALGGGFELAMHCCKVFAHPEAIIGLPETGAGLIPAGGGTALMRLRGQPEARDITECAKPLILGDHVAAPLAFQPPFLRSIDELLINPDQGIWTAMHAEIPAPTTTEWLPASPQLSGMIDAFIKQARSNGTLGEYGELLAEEIKHLFVKPASYEEALENEIEVFLKLLGKPLTIMRIKHLLDTGKPLRN